MKQAKDKVKDLNDQVGNLDDSLAAAEYRAEGLQMDIKALEKELSELKSNQLEGKLAMGDKDEAL